MTVYKGRRPRKDCHGAPPSFSFKRVCCFTFCVFIVLIGAAIAVFLLSFNTSKECSEDSDCSDSCTIGTCTGGVCKKEKICCSQDSDCQQETCGKKYCDPSTLTCRLLPPLNGSVCNDYDECTENDVCVGYVCKGTPKHCVSSTCASSECKMGQCVLQTVPDGVPCSTPNKCVSSSSCKTGLCWSNTVKDCSHLESGCTRGECVPDTGECVSIAINNMKSCDDGVQCTTGDTCRNGHCSGVENPCYDNNPCTFNKCVEGYGCMLKYNITGENACSATCETKWDCPDTGDNWACADGTCTTLDYNGSSIRFIDYEIEQCGLGHRLVMDFILDTEFFSSNTETWYLIPNSVDDITEGTTDLGFIDQKRALNSMVVADYVRTGFTLTTQCQNVTALNCDQIFSNRRYQFQVQLYHCEQLQGPCQNTQIMVSSSIALSISDCTNFPQTQHVPLYGTGFLNVLGQKYTGIQQDPQLTTGIYDFIVGYESPAINNPSFKTMITSLRACRANIDHYMYDCVSGADDKCTITGCYNWDPSDSPVVEYHDIMVDSVLTSIAKTDWVVRTCYPEDKYNIPNKCQLQTCDWGISMDDGFELKTRPLESYEKHLWTFDIRFKAHLCNNLLANANNEYHNIVTLLI